MPIDLAARIAAKLPELQRQAESMMRETCTIGRPGEVSIDDEGREVVTSTPVYSGPLRIRSFRPYPEDRDVATGTSTAQVYDLHIPAVERMAVLVGSGAVVLWAGPVRNGDVMTRTTPGRAEEVYRVETEHDMTNQTAQRLVGKLITGGVWS